MATINSSEFLPYTITADKITAVPVYGSFWRWLTRRPRYWNIVVHLSVDARDRLRNTVEDSWKGPAE